MQVPILPFVEFAYGDKRKDKSLVERIMNDLDKDYDPSTDRYKQFRENLKYYEDGHISKDDFLKFYKNVTPNKMNGYELLSRNYLDLKEDHGLIWDGAQRVSAKVGPLEIRISWHLHTNTSNLNRVIFLNFRKNSLPMKQERALLTLLQIAVPSSSGAGILNLQPSTLILQNRIDQSERKYLFERAEKFYEIASKI